jgi:hypothetical protein
MFARSFPTKVNMAVNFFPNNSNGYSNVRIIFKKGYEKLFFNVAVYIITSRGTGSLLLECSSRTPTNFYFSKCFFFLFARVIYWILSTTELTSNIFEKSLPDSVVKTIFTTIVWRTVNYEGTGPWLFEFNVDNFRTQHNDKLLFFLFKWNVYIFLNIKPSSH